jgi:hypothetical protein
MGITAGFRRKALPRIDGSRSIIKSGATQTISVRDVVLVGGFLSYRISLRENFRRAAGLAKPTAFVVAKLARGGKPEEMPVDQPTKFQFVINPKTAKSLGLTVPRYSALPTKSSNSQRAMRCWSPPSGKYFGCRAWCGGSFL